MFRKALILLGVIAAWLLLVQPSPALADEGWTIEQFHAEITIAQSGDLQITETILVNFNTLERRGIFRYIPVEYDYDAESNRVYDLSVLSVTDAQGRSHPYRVERNEATIEIRIGDPDRTITGRQSYRITYRVAHVLNGFAEHDELYWNVNGTWPVQTQRVETIVNLPEAGIQDTICFIGRQGSTERCNTSHDERTARFATNRPLQENEQLTIVVGFDKGIVPEPAPMLVAKPRSFDQFFEVTPAIAGVTTVGLVGMLGLLGWSWWTHGRDRRYTSLYYLTDDPAEETRPLLSRDPIVVEYTPPEQLRPAQLGVLLDERADTLDVTATIVDLAVRGYLTITEIPAGGFLGGIFGQTDWQLNRTGKGDGNLLPYERIILDGLFASGAKVHVSDLRNKYYKHLARAQSALYQDVLERRWFTSRPDHARSAWRAGGVGLLIGGGGVAAGLGYLLGAGLVGVPIALGGLAMTVLSNWMPKRTAHGRELLRRTLGFRQYVATAEKHRQDFNEQQNIFAAYLPYAIVFHCVDKWAKAFSQIDVAAATQSWYTGTSLSSPNVFSRHLQSFSQGLTMAAASTPSSSGRSGFSGGSSGGGGGGGGGGSW